MHHQHAEPCSNSLLRERLPPQHSPLFRRKTFKRLNHQSRSRVEKPSMAEQPGSSRARLQELPRPRAATKQRRRRRPSSQLQITPQDALRTSALTRPRLFTSPMCKDEAQVGGRARTHICRAVALIFLRSFWLYQANACQTQELEWQLPARKVTQTRSQRWFLQECALKTCPAGEERESDLERSKFQKRMLMLS